MSTLPEGRLSEDMVGTKFCSIHLRKVAKQVINKRTLTNKDWAN